MRRGERGLCGGVQGELGVWLVAHDRGRESSTLVKQMASGKVKWDIRDKGRAWVKEEILGRYELTPHKIEIIEGKLLWSDEDRVNLLGLLLENIGADRAVQLGDADVWRQAVAKLPR